MNAGRTVQFALDEFAALVGVFAGNALVDWEAYARARERILRMGLASGLVAAPLARPPTASKGTEKGS
jgi:hypothetical protein